MSCPRCQEAARCVGLRQRRALGLLGSLRLKRHYYHCTDCQRGHCPFDEMLRLEGAELTPAALEAVSLAGVLESFKTASERILPKLCGLRVSESTVERSTEAVGHEVGERLSQGETFGACQEWNWHEDQEGKSCAYVSVDATGTGQQGPGGQKAEGRMAFVASIYNPVPEDWHQRPHGHGQRPALQARYLAGLEGLSALGEPLRRQAAQVGMEKAQRWLAITDAGAGLEDFVKVHFPMVEVVILDFYHVAEHLSELAQLYFSDPAEAKTQSQAWCHQLKHEGGKAVLATLKDLPARCPKRAREKLRQVVGYFQNHQHRMDYPTYQAKGWQIGSGTIESACKSVVGQRLKGPGMRWSPSGADSLCHLRALFKSGADQWNAFWQTAA